MKLLKVVSLVLMAPFFVLFSARVFAADSGQVTATVTVQNISLTVSDGTISYGTLPINSSKATVNLAPADTQTITNNGNVNEKFSVRGTDSASWTLSSSAGVDQYVHKFCASSCSTPPTGYTALSSGSYTTLSASVAPSGTASLDLEITTPTSSTVFTSQSVNVTVQAALPD
ncbi:hypothetical protein GYA44_03455 [Candidatus Microgenomates bacterium]|nr:hypothetical protein [Candidatus Microgenomates bacterium]